MSANHYRAGLIGRHFRRDEVIAIREAAAAGRSYRSLADEHDVCPKTIENMVFGRTYRDFGGPIREKRS
jgi:hypothetical protein